MTISTKFYRHDGQMFTEIRLNKPTVNKMLEMIQELKHVDRSGFSLMPWLDEFERFAQKVSRQGGKIVTTAMCDVKPREVQALLTPIVDTEPIVEPESLTEKVPGSCQR